MKPEKNTITPALQEYISAYNGDAESAVEDIIILALIGNTYDAEAYLRKEGKDVDLGMGIRQYLLTDPQDTLRCLCTVTGLTAEQLQEKAHKWRCYNFD